MILNRFVPFITMICLCSCLKSYGQVVYAKGVITERGTKIRIALAEITNKKNKLAVGSNDLGFFQIKADIGDTLLITKRNFISQQVVVTYNRELIIALTREALALQEVTIKGQTRKQDLEDIRKEFRNKGSFYEGKPPISLLNPFGGSPLTFFYELLGKTPRKARRFKRYYDKEVKQIEIEQYFNKTIITSNTNLQGEALDKFMLNYAPGYKTVQNWSNYDAVKYIKEAAQRYTDSLNNQASHHNQ